MNRLIVLIYVCFIVLSFTFAQADSTKQYLLTTSTENISLTTVDLLDPYLSPLVYTGVGVGYQHSDMKYFKRHIGKMSHESRFSILAANTYNPQYSSSVNYVGGQYQWGMHYHFRPLEGLHLLAGGNAGALMAVKSNERNVNNPVNVDAALDLGFSGIANYDFSLWWKKFTVSFQLEFPLLGMMYIPMQGASYYEMFTGGDLSNTLHFSSLHNRLARTSGLKLEIPTKNSTWHIGVSTTKLKYEANDMFFKQNNYNFNVGYTYDLYIFRGRKNLPPHNFISVKQ
ncbi:MAG: DUF3316 domain-containing protein [Paludibacter sp.]|jgi:hypothetical protein|nr:DUF3316 domain-containing protein [Paludibacter sp.]